MSLSVDDARLKCEIRMEKDCEELQKETWTECKESVMGDGINANVWHVMKMGKSKK